MESENIGVKCREKILDIEFSFEQICHGLRKYLLNLKFKGNSWRSDNIHAYYIFAVKTNDFQFFVRK